MTVKEVREIFWEKAEFCKQVKSFPKIKDFVKTELRRAAHGTIGKPDFLRRVYGQKAQTTRA